MNKLYINNIPVYREDLESGEIKYVLFDENENDSGTVLIIYKKFKNRIEEFEYVLEYIRNMTTTMTNTFYKFNTVKWIKNED